MNVFQIEITSSCNHNCIHCYQHWTNQVDRVNYMMPKDNFKFIYEKIIEATNGNCAIDITGGEPFINFETILYAYELNKGIPISINTNFTMDTSLLERLIEQTADKINLLVSVPSMKKDIYNKITDTSNFERLINNLKFIKQHKERFNICANIVVSKLNYDNVTDTINRLLLYGINQIKVTKMASIYNVSDNTINDIVLSDEETVILYTKVLELQEENSSFVFRRSATCIPTCIFPNEEKFKIFNYVCSAGSHLFSVLPNGDIKPCPNLPSNFIIGNIFEDNLQEIIVKGKQFSTVQKGRFFKCHNCELYKKHRCMGGCLIQPLLSSKNNELIPLMDSAQNIDKDKHNLL